MTSPVIAVRDATYDDIVFVLSSWKANYWDVHAKHYVRWQNYKLGMPALINRLLGRSAVPVAFSPDVPSEIFGWACIEHGVCHYVYTKSCYRRQGIGRGLVRGCDRYTHWTGPLGKKFAEEVGMQFDPFLVF